MNSLINALDQHVSKNIGENAHIQNNWSNDVRKKIGELYFQLVRSKDHSDLEMQWRIILTSFVGKERLNEFCSVIKMIANTRDVVDGKGEQQLSFMMLYSLFDYYPEIAKFVFVKFITMEDEHCLGSFKDIKYFCNYIKDRSNENNFFIEYILNICVNLLKNDEIAYSKGEPITLFGKWFPREKSKKFGWLNKKFAEIYYYNIMITAYNPIQKKQARKKCLLNLRKLLAKLNKYLDTTQIKMAGKNWSQIDFNKVTGPTLRIHKKSFQNKNKNDDIRSYEYDRIKCAENLKGYLKDSMDGKTTVKGKRVEMYKLVKDALLATTEDEINMVNEQWKDNSSVNKELDHYLIPMADTSGSMECDENIPMYNSIGFGIRVSEKTHPAFRNRILTFNTTPTWFQLSDDMTFHQKVKTMKGDNNWGGSTNFYKALEMILDVYIINNIPPHEVGKMILAIFSDMQITKANGNINLAILMENIKLLYNEAGLKSMWKTPYPVPHILLWNLRKTKGFPSSVYEPNTSMISGYSPVLLNTFVEKGMNELKNVTPFSLITDILNNKRYRFIDEFINILIK